MSVHPLKVLVWNVHGLNAQARRNALFQVVVAANSAIVCLEETKLQVVSVNDVSQCLGNRHDNFLYLPATGTRGGILIAWDDSITHVSNPHYTNHTLTVLVKCPDEEQAWCLTCVYGPQDEVDKIEFMQDLVDIRDLHAGPWLVAGDFNLLARQEDKINEMVN